MVESEDPSFAADETEKQVRRRRIRFYEKNGFVKKATHPDCIRIGALSRDDHFYCRRIV